MNALDWIIDAYTVAYIFLAVFICIGLARLFVSFAVWIPRAIREYAWRNRRKAQS